jgi:Lsr2
MAQKVTTHLVDDLTGETIEPGTGKSLHFAFDGNNYEIDLTDANVDAIRELFADYIAAARKVGNRTGRVSASPSTRNDPNELAKIRSWAAENGHDVSSRGRISRAVRDAYTAAH